MCVCSHMWRHVRKIVKEKLQVEKALKIEEFQIPEVEAEFEGREEANISRVLLECLYLHVTRRGSVQRKKGLGQNREDETRAR